MKKIIIIVIVSLFSQCFWGIEKQIKVKKGIVYLDGIPVVKMEGDCGLFTPLNYTFFSLKGDTLFSIKVNGVSFKNPVFKPISWYEINFIKLKKAMLFPRELTLVTDKQVVKYILLKFDPFIIKDGELDTTAVNQVIKNQDIRSKIEADTAYFFDLERKMYSAHAKPTIARNKSYPIHVTYATRNYHLKFFSEYKPYEIIQDNVVIGVIAEVTDIIMKNTSLYFFRKLDDPIEHKGETFQLIPVAYIEDVRMGMLTRIYGKKLESYTSSQTQYIQRLEDYASYLVKMNEL